MARRAPAPTPATQVGSRTAKFVKKAPKAIVWLTGLFALIGAVLGTVLGLIGLLFREVSNGIGPGFWDLFQLGFVLGFGGVVVLYLRFAAFEDVQEGGRAFLASVGIALVTAVAFRMFLPMFAGHETLRSLFIGGIAIAAIMAIVGLFTDFKLKHTIGWGALLVAVSLLLLLILNAKADGFNLRSLWDGNGGKGKEERIVKNELLHSQRTSANFNNVDWDLSHRFEVLSSQAKSLRWSLDKDSACGTVIINDQYRIERCPKDQETKPLGSLRKAGILRSSENPHSLQFQGRGMKGVVLSE